MTYEQLKLWIDVAQFAVMSAIGVWLYLERRNDKTNTRVTELGDKLDVHDGRLVRMETQVKHMPQTPDLEKLYERIRTVDHTTTKMEGEFREVRRTLGLIHTYLMTKEKP